MDVDAESDVELWKRVSTQDDLQAFAVLHGRHVDRVHRHCFARLGIRTDAEEATNQVFFETWRKRRKIRVDEQGLLPWLFTVAGNVVRNHARTTHRRGALLARLTNSAEESHDVVDIDDRLDSQRYAKALRRALSKLRPAAQEIVGLCVIECFSYDEAARHLRVPVGTVRSRLSRAKAELRLTLAAQGIQLEAGGEW
ncbi:MAG: RNA polymerase sigma factor [Umezawaea sp.]